MTGRLVAFLLLVFSNPTKVWATVRPAVMAEISRIADTSHIEFRGLKNWRYELQRENERKISLSVPAIDEASMAKLQGYTDSFIKEIKVDKSGSDGNFIIFVTLNDKDVEAFDYQTDDPSRLIIDFYQRSEGDEKSQAATKKEGQKAETAIAKKTKIEKPRSKSKPLEADQAYVKVHHPNRMPAGDEFLSVDQQNEETPKADVKRHFGIFDSGDESFDRFRIKDYEVHEEAVISSRQNIYLPFPMLKMKISHLDELVEHQPEYLIHAKETRENKEARLLQVLFQRKRFGVFMKTYDYFVKRYPESEYLEILKNMAAHVHLMKWREEGKSDEYDIARAMYHELVQKFPDSVLREHNYLILGYMQYERGDALATMQTLQGFIETYPSSSEIPQIRKALADSFVKLRRYEEALNQYKTIIKDFPKSEQAKEAQYRIGDVAFAKGDYGQAIQNYEAAIKELPAQEKAFPNANFNMAEARFWQKDFKKSLNNYIRFVSLFPTHDFGGYALTRVGELLGILGADQRQVMGAFLESYFRFPNHPGAKVARIRMLSQQMRGMKPNEEKKAIDEIQQYAEKLDLPGIKEFTTLMMSEGFTNRGEYRDSLASLISYYQTNPTSGNLESFKARILRNLANELKDLVEKGRFMQALQFYNQYSSTWLKNSERIDVPFFVAGAYERAGAFSEAQTIYKDALARRTAIVETNAEKEKKVQEHLPSVASLHLRMAAVSAQERNYLQAYQHLKAIGQGLELSPTEVIERVQLSAAIAEQRNEPARAREALTQLAKEWGGDPALLAPVNLQLAQSYLKLKEFKQAENYASRVLNSEGGESTVPEKVIADAFLAKGEAELAEKRPMAAVETYQKLLERFESKMPLSSVRYKVGQILFERGDVKGASEVWGRLAGTPGDFLWKIGREKLEDSKWKDDYRKYTSRIPAMSTRGEIKP